VRQAIIAELDVATWNRYREAERLELVSITETVQAWNSISGLDQEYEARA
jgi:hypothetical protein